MTALIADPPVFVHTLADRQGRAAALLCSVAAGAGSALPLSLLAALAGGRMPCFFRADGDPQHAAPLQAAGWQALAADTLHRVDGGLEQELPAAALWLEGMWCMAPPARTAGAQVASRALALQLVQLVSADADTHEIEAVLRQDPSLSYHLLKLVNSLGMATGRRVTSFAQALLILGRTQLRRWLHLMLFSAREGDRRSPMLLARVSVRARAMELLAHEAGLNKNQQEQAFMVGMFSLLGVLFGMPLAQVLAPLTISDASQAALLGHEGHLGQLLSLVEAAERDDYAALEHTLAHRTELVLAPSQFNRIIVEACLWMQAVAADQAADTASPRSVAGVAGTSPTPGSQAGRHA